MTLRERNPGWMPIVCLLIGLLTTELCRAEGDLLKPVADYVKVRTTEFDRIPPERQAVLKQLADYARSRTDANEPAKLTFICTHNSRRSHMSQIWAAVAADYYRVKGVETYSGGTEATAFNPRAIAALQRAGLTIDKAQDGKNPRYAVRFRTAGDSLVCFSKVYHEAPNPQAAFCAVMTCSQADQNCPIVKGSALRIAIPFEDPKSSDDKPEELGTYDERCQQICREMLYLFSLVKH